MTREEAAKRIEYLKFKAEVVLANSNTESVRLKAGVEATITALTMAIKALEKQIPKKPALEKTKGIVGIDMWHCPVCDGEIISDWNRDIANPYCHLCGQRLNWSKPKGDSYDFAIIDEVIAYDTQKED